MKRKGYSDNQIEAFCKDAITGKKDIKEPPIFKKDATIDFSRMALAAIKIAYEYAFDILGEDYINDGTAILFADELNNIIKAEKKDILVSPKLARFVTCFISGNPYWWIYQDGCELIRWH